MSLLLLLLCSVHSFTVDINGVALMGDANGIIDETGLTVPSFWANNVRVYAYSNNPIDPYMSVHVSGFTTLGMDAPVTLVVADGTYGARSGPSRIHVECRFGSLDTGTSYYANVSIDDGTTSVLSGTELTMEGVMPAVAAPFSMETRIGFVYPHDGPRGGGFMTLTCDVSTTPASAGVETLE